MQFSNSFLSSFINSFFWLLFNNTIKFKIFFSFPLSLLNAWKKCLNAILLQRLLILRYSWSAMIRDSTFENKQEHINSLGTETKKKTTLGPSTKIIDVLSTFTSVTCKRLKFLWQWDPQTKYFALHTSELGFVGVIFTPQIYN